MSVPPAIPQPRALPTIVMSRDIGGSVVRTGVQRGDLVRVRAGAYIEGPLPVAGWEAREVMALAHIAAVMRQLSAPVVVSHESAALLHGCWVPGLDGATHVLQRTMPSQPGSRDIARSHTRHLPPEDVVEINGLPVTSLERTITDCALALPSRRALAIADSGMRVLARPDRFSRGASEARIEALRGRLSERLAAHRGARGVVGARAVVAHADPFSESPGETDVRWIAVSRGLPRPVAQLQVDTDEGTFFLDLGWLVDDDGAGRPVRLIAAEFDGAGKYGASGTPAPGNEPPSGASLYDEKIREDAIRRARNATFNRFIGRHLTDVNGVFRRLCQGFPRHILRRLAPVPGLQPPPRRR
jgi:predicted transcriptional regulator of viral defense system